MLGTAPRSLEILFLRGRYPLGMRIFRRRRPEAKNHIAWPLQRSTVIVLAGVAVLGGLMFFPFTQANPIVGQWLGAITTLLGAAGVCCAAILSTWNDTDIEQNQAAEPSPADAVKCFEYRKAMSYVSPDQKKARTRFREIEAVSAALVLFGAAITIAVSVQPHPSVLDQLCTELKEKSPTPAAVADMCM